MYCYVLKSKMYCLVQCTFLLLLRGNTGKGRDRFGGMVRFNCGSRGRSKVKSVLVDVIANVFTIPTCNYMHVHK